MSQIRADFEAVKALDWVSGATLDELMMEVVIDGQEFTFMIPEEYPRGEPALFGAVTAQLRAGKLAELCEQARALWKKESGGGGGMGGREDTSDFTANLGVSAQSALGKDIVAFNKRFGNGMASVRSFESSEWVTINIPCDTLVDETTARAWGIKRQFPITIVLKFSTKSYLEQSRSPKIEMSQNGETFPLGQQLCRNLSLYFERQWTGRWTPFRSDTLSAIIAKAEGTQRHKSTNLNASQLVLSEEQQLVCNQLKEMGFEDNYAQAAAYHCANIHDALEFDPSTVVNSRPSRPTPPPTKQHKVDPLVEKFKDGGQGKSYDAQTDPNKFVSYDDAKGFLIHIAEVIQKRIPTCHRYCVICDKPHVFAASSMLKASVCSRDVCVFAFQEFKVGGDAAESVATDGGVVDLMINIFRACVKSNRAEQVLQPFPHVFDPKNPSKAVFDPKHPDHAKLRAVTEHFPSVRDLVGADDLASLKINLNKKDPLAYPLLEWIINSNRSLIIKMDRAHHIEPMKTPHQYLLVTAPPEKQKKFNDLKAKHGTVFAFHGSSIENWHAILRTGLRNASGTKLQVNGAAHGSGIYFAPQASSSLGYCRNSMGSGSGGTPDRRGGDQFISDDGMICMALCEIVKDGIKDHGWCWTLEDEERVVTRFFFAFDKNSGSNVDADTKNSTFQNHIRQTLKFYGLD